MSRKLCRSLIMFLTGFTSLFSVLLPFPLSITFFVFVHAWFLILFHLTKIRFSQSNHLRMCLSLETLTSIIQTSSPILVELINLVNSVIIFLSQVTLLRSLTFLLGSQTVILIVLLFWISFLTLVFALQWVPHYWETLIILLSQFPLTFHQIHKGIPCFIAELVTILALIETVL